MGLKKDLLLVLTIESVVLGVVIGFVIRPFKPRCVGLKYILTILNPLKGTFHNSDFNFHLISCDKRRLALNSALEVIDRADLQF